VYPFVVVYNDSKWNMEKRFSDFAALDEALDELYKGEEDVQLPEFPEKKMFGSLSPALIKERQVGRLLPRPSCLRGDAAAGIVSAAWLAPVVAVGNGQCGSLRRKRARPHRGIWADESCFPCLFRRRLRST